MPASRLKLAPTAADLVRGFKRIRAAMELPDGFPQDVLDAAELAAARKPQEGDDHRPRPEVELITIDPPGSRDLDQAFQAERTGEGFIVRYAIADPGWFISPGDPIDLESRRRGQTLYAPDARVRLYPPVLSEGAASLLEGQIRPAILWEMTLDRTGALSAVDLNRALVTSREQMTYEEAQREIDGGAARGSLRLLAEIGRLRQEKERERGGLHIELPEQEVSGPAGDYALAFRGPLPVEEWNAQISLLTGMTAAHLMLEGRTGILRTMTPPDKESLEALRRTAQTLHLEWPAGLTYQEFLHRVDPSDQSHAALMNVALRLFSGAGYVAFDDSSPDETLHSGVASPYAHVTAPLRRLADRFANEVALSLCGGQAPPIWVRDALVEMPEIMKESHRRNGELERRIVDFVEAAILEPHVGQEFDALVVEAGEKSGSVQLLKWAVVGHCKCTGLELGTKVRVKLKEADPDKTDLEFELAQGPARPSPS
jgi:exoribonuclease R